MAQPWGLLSFLMAADPNKSYHGTPCKNCGGTLRLKSNKGCTVCARRRTREWYHNNPEKVRAWWEAYQQNPEVRERRRKWFAEKAANDPEWANERREYQRRLYADLDHVAYYERQMKHRRRQALKRKEQRHGPLSNEG